MRQMRLNLKGVYAAQSVSGTGFSLPQSKGATKGDKSKNNGKIGIDWFVCECGIFISFNNFDPFIQVGSFYGLVFEQFNDSLPSKRDRSSTYA